MVLWTAIFEDETVLKQPEDDRYSKHDDSKEHNPSAFRDIQEYPSKVAVFKLGDWMVDLTTGDFLVDGVVFKLEDEPLTDRKLIYYRIMESDWLGSKMSEPRLLKYAIGYEGKNDKGKVEKKVVYING